MFIFTVAITLAVCLRGHDAAAFISIPLRPVPFWPHCPRPATTINTIFIITKWNVSQFEGGSCSGIIIISTRLSRLWTFLKIQEKAGYITIRNLSPQHRNFFRFAKIAEKHLTGGTTIIVSTACPVLKDLYIFMRNSYCRCCSVVFCCS